MSDKDTKDSNEKDAANGAKVAAGEPAPPEASEPSWFTKLAAGSRQVRLTSRILSGVFALAGVASFFVMATGLPMPWLAGLRLAEPGCWLGQEE